LMIETESSVRNSKDSTAGRNTAVCLAFCRLEMIARMG
jgi:hypothetical protein